MSLGKLYVLPQSPRSKIVLDVVKALDLDVEIITELDDKFKKAFPLAKAPAFIGPKGFKLHECIAISLYLLSSVPESKLLGKNKEEYASIVKYLTFSNAEVISAISGTLQFVKSYAPYNKKIHDESLANLDKYAEIFETRLLNYTYLVGERFSIADAFSIFIWSSAYTNFLGKPFADKHPNITRWLKSVSKNSFFNGQLDDFSIPSTVWTFTPPKKEKKAKEQPKKEAAPKKETAPDAEPAAAPKPKHPLEALGKPKTPLDEWKRVYSNEETRETAIPWFWENQFNPEEWSLWKVDYKYNDELTLTFMSNNLVGGFFNRLAASTKYIFGCMVVYGENNNNGITGAFMIRGQEHEPAFSVAPDWESYSFTKLDPTSEETKKFVNNMLAWDEPVDVNGEKREIADGKVCK